MIPVRHTKVWIRNQNLACESRKEPAGETWFPGEGRASVIRKEKQAEPRGPRERLCPILAGELSFLLEKAVFEGWGHQVETKFYSRVGEECVKCNQFSIAVPTQGKM